MSTAANHLRLIKAVLQSTLPVATASLRQNFIHILSSVSGSNTITATAFPGIAAYTYPTVVVMIPATTNTAATTLNVDTRGAVAVQNINGTACVGGELVAGIPAILLLNAAATAWIISNYNQGIFATPSIKTANYTTTATDGGKTFYVRPTASTFTITTTAVPDAQCFNVYTTAALTVSTSSGNLFWFNGSSASTGSRSVAAGGVFSVIVNSLIPEAYITGSGIT